MPAHTTTAAPQLRDSISLERYQSTIASVTYEEFVDAAAAQRSGSGAELDPAVQGVRLQVAA